MELARSLNVSSQSGKQPTRGDLKLPSDRLLYLAYGSNMNRWQMNFRCPEAVALGTFKLPGFRLVFRGSADIDPRMDAFTHCVLWRITRECEKALDRYEDFPTLYGKEYIDTNLGKSMIYRMVEGRYGIDPPTIDYYRTIRRGYNDFNLDLEPLTAALNHSRECLSNNGFRSRQCRTRFVR